MGWVNIQAGSRCAGVEQQDSTEKGDDTVEGGYLDGYPYLDDNEFVEELIAWAAGEKKEPEKQQEAGE